MRNVNTVNRNHVTGASVLRIIKQNIIIALSEELSDYGLVQQSRKIVKFSQKIKIKYFN